MFVRVRVIDVHVLIIDMNISEHTISTRTLQSHNRAFQKNAWR